MYITSMHVTNRDVVIKTSLDINIVVKLNDLKIMAKHNNLK
jgi:hypothetical protein